MPDGLFEFGTVVATRGVIDWMNSVGGPAYVFVLDCMARHARGDWGAVDEEDAETNNAAVLFGARILSSYRLPDIGLEAPEDDHLWIVTEADRSATTFLFPSEY